MSVISVTYKSIVKILAMPVTVINPITKKNKKYESQWDTGCEQTVISERVADELGIPLDGIMLLGGVGGYISARKADVNLTFLEGVSISIVVCVAPMKGKVDVVIGMDIISQGDVKITNSKGVTRFSFAMPSDENRFISLSMLDNTQDTVKADK